MKRDDMSRVFQTLDFWLAAFSDSARYKVYIWNENITELPDKYRQYSIIDRDVVMRDNECSALYRMIQSTTLLDDKWRGAAFALYLPNVFLSEDYVYNVDSDDLILEGDIKHYLDSIEKELISRNLPVLSSDIYLSVPNNSWSYGINLSNRVQFGQIVNRALQLKTGNPGWGRNLDHQVSEHFRLVDTAIPFIAFTTKDKFKHGGEGGLHSWFDTEHNRSCCSLYGKRTVYGAKNQRTLLIQ